MPNPTSFCDDYQALPGPSGYCFYWLRLKLGGKEIPYCGHPDHLGGDCPTEGYLYRQYFPRGEKPQMVNHGRDPNRRRRRRKG